MQQVTKIETSDVPEGAPLFGLTEEVMERLMKVERSKWTTFRLLPTGAKARKDTPLCTGVLDYFPLALAEVARVSKAGNDQHNPGEPLHWSREKSRDHADCILRHLMERGTVGADGMRHSAQLAWRALALLQVELETEKPSGVEWVDPRDTLRFTTEKNMSIGGTESD